VFPSHSPATFTRVRLGATLNEQTSGSGADNNFSRNEATLDYYLAYGLPGKDGYTYDRPFDYFDFQFTAVSNKNVIENLMTRGLLYGKKYQAGDNYRGVWGLYGGFDYISPQVFRVSSTALSLGTTGQWWLSRAIALQGSASAGIGYGAGGTVHPTEERDYHYGGTGQGLLAARLILGDQGHARHDGTRVLHQRPRFPPDGWVGAHLPRERGVHREHLQTPRDRDPVRQVGPGCVRFFL